MTSAHIVAVVAIVFGTLYAMYDLKVSNKAKSKSKSEMDELKKEIDELKKEVSSQKERLVVLEKIVTDQKFDLKNEINSL